jgi:glycine/D-amino acid oxidase-like deaminating enzyme
MTASGHLFPLNASVVIIGGGVIELSAAYHLAV